MNLKHFLSALSRVPSKLNIYTHMYYIQFLFKAFIFKNQEKNKGKEIKKMKEKKTWQKLAFDSGSWHFWAYLTQRRICIYVDKVHEL